MEIGAKQRTISYAQCIVLIQQELLDWEHGRMSKWCKEHNLTYNSIVTVKTNRLGYFAPKLIGDILHALGYQVYQVHDISKRKKRGKPKDNMSLDALVNAKMKEKEDRKFTTMYVVSKPNPEGSTPEIALQG